jgi:peptide/nickel transport system substrate-binding protein
MDKLKIALLALVAVLLLVQIVDRSREPGQIGELKRSIEALNATLQRQARAATAAPSSAHTAAAVVEPADARRDGNPKLDVNFLVPYDGSHFNPEWVGGTLRSLGSTSKGLNPLTDSSGPTQDVHRMLNGTLCFRHPAAPERWMAGLAESLVISDDYTVYTFVIRRGIRWQTPTLASRSEFAWIPKDVELSAKDFKFTLDLIRDPDVRCPSLKAYYEDVERVEAPDDATLRIVWKRKVYTSLSYSMELEPLPRHIYGRNRDGSEVPSASLGIQFNQHWFDQERQAIGVGGYSLEAYEPDQVVRFRRNPDFWGGGSHFEIIEWNCSLKQPDAQLVAFKNGDVQAYVLDPDQYKSEIIDRHEPRFAAVDPANPKAGRSGDLAWERCKWMRFSYVGWNNRSDLFRDRRVRQAMSHAFPKDRIIADVFFGLGQPVLSDVDPDSQYYNREMKPFAFDLAHARALLIEAGWSDTTGDGVIDHDDGKGGRKEFAFEVKYYTDAAEWDSTLLIYRNELRKLGIDMRPKTYEFKELMRIYEDKDFDAVVGIWGMDWDVDYFQLWHSSEADKPGSSNHCAFANKRVDELADQLRRTFATDERISIAKEIQAIIHEEQPYTFFMSTERAFCWQNKGPPAKERYLDGVEYGLDHFHPLMNRSRHYWHFRD